MSLVVRPNSGLSFPWEEHIDRGPGYSQNYVFADGQAQAAFTIDCDWSVFTSGVVVPEILGYVRLNRAVSPPALSRTKPFRHPIFPYLWANKIANVTGIRTNSKDPIRNSALYERARITIGFAQVSYRIMDDATLAGFFNNKEFSRWMTMTVDPEAQYLTRGVGAWKWAQGPLAASQQDVTFGIPELLGKERLNLLWHRVPASGLFGAGLIARAAKQEDGIGKVNSNTFLGHLPETLLLADIGYRVSMIPQPASDLGLSFPFLDPSLCYDVMFSIVRFDPPFTNSAEARGHNIYPQPKVGPWALVTTTGAVGGTRVFPSYNYDELFVLQ